MTTQGDVRVSRSLKSRPARMGTPIVWKYPGLTQVNFERAFRLAGADPE